MYWPNFLRKQLAWITSNGPIEHSVYIDCFHCHIKIERMLLNYYIFAIHLYILSVVQTCKDVVRVKAKALFPSMKKITHRVNWWLASSMLNCLLLMFFFLNLRFICCVFYYLLILLCFVSLRSCGGKSFIICLSSPKFFKTIYTMNILISKFPRQRKNKFDESDIYKFWMIWHATILKLQWSWK